MPSSECKIWFKKLVDLIKDLWECKRFSARRLIKEFPTRIGKDRQWTTFCKSCNNHFNLMYFRKRSQSAMVVSGCG